MVYRFLEDFAIADFAFEVEADTLPALFSEASKALLHIQIGNPEVVLPKTHLQIQLFHKDLDVLLYLFLEELVYHKDVKQLLLYAEKIMLTNASGHHHLKASVAGEVLDPNRHEQRADIKAITLHHFRLEEKQASWKATVVVDV